MNEDRADWLRTLANLIESRTQVDENGVIACSALKKAYREILKNANRKEVRFVYLQGNYDAIFGRLQNRKDHFMKSEMLKSQLATLEEPAEILSLSVNLSQKETVQKIMEQLVETKYALGILGLGVMGRSLAMNFARNGYAPIGYDLAPKLPADFDIEVTNSLEELVGTLTSPRILFLMVPAGNPVDNAIAALKPYLNQGDIIIDGGNSYFSDSERRGKELQQTGIDFIGMGVSGGESGALWGPSMMPGGSITAWPIVQDMFKAISAKTENGEACVNWMGAGGAHAIM